MADNRNGHPYPASDELHAQWDAPAEIIALSATAAKNATAAYPAGVYLLVSTADVFLRSSPFATAAATAVSTTVFSLFLKAGTYARWQVTSSTDNGSLNAVLAASTGSLYIMKPNGVQS